MKILIIFISILLGFFPSIRLLKIKALKKSSYFLYIISEALKIIIPCSICILSNNNNMLPSLIIISLTAGSIYPRGPIYNYAPIIPYFTGSLVLSPKVFLILILIYISVSLILREYLLAFLIVTALCPFIFIFMENSVPLFIFGLLSAGLFYLKYYLSKI